MAFFRSKEKKKITPVIFVVDVSGSMDDERMQSVNEILASTVNKFAEGNALGNGLVKYAILRVGSEVTWMTEGLISSEKTIVLEADECSKGAWDIALKQLNEKLVKKELFLPRKKYEAPVICFISGQRYAGHYPVLLRKLHQNKWFERATKIVMTIERNDDCGIKYRMLRVWEDFFGVWRLPMDAFGHVGGDITGNSADELKRAFWFRLRKSLPHTRGVQIKLPEGCFGAHSRCVREKSLNCSLYAKRDIDKDRDCVRAERELRRLEELKRIEQEFSALVLEQRIREEEKRRSSSVSLMEMAPPALDDAFLSKHSDNGSVVPNFALSEKKEDEQNSFVPASQRIDIKRAHFSAVVPTRLTKGAYGVIDIAVYEEAYRHIVDRLIANGDGESREIIASAQEIADETLIRILLSSPDIDVNDCDETQKWKGQYLTYSFPVEIPSDYAKRQILFVASVYFNGVIATKLKFVVNCISTKEQKLELLREDVLSAFISYASQDRSRVATIIQGMKKARPDMDIFFDVESLRSGEDWEKALRREIEARDILFLCWSQFAKESPWVEKEWRYALENKGLESIEPIPLIAPDQCPPPEELKSKHFNDRALFYI